MRRPALVRLHFEGCFEDGFGERDAFEALSRGYRSHVWAELDDGSRYQLTFFDVTRLAQSLEVECKDGRPFFTEPGLIIVPEVTLAHMEAAARALAPRDSSSATWRGPPARTIPRPARARDTQGMLLDQR